MNHKTRRKFSSEFKAQVVIEAIQERESIESLCKRHGLHPNQIRDWKREFLSASHRIFDKEDLGRKVKSEDELISELYRQIGELKVANEFLKKKLKPYQ